MLLNLTLNCSQCLLACTVFFNLPLVVFTLCVPPVTEVTDKVTKSQQLVVSVPAATASNEVIAPWCIHSLNKVGIQFKIKVKLSKGTLKRRLNYLLT